MVGIMANTLFTIEQIELIRRLRATGITKEQVAEAFEQLERLDVEMGKQKLHFPLQGNNSSQRMTMQLAAANSQAANPNCSVSSSSCNFENSTSNTNNHHSSSDTAGTGLNITITKVESLPNSGSCQLNGSSSAASLLSSMSSHHLPHLNNNHTNSSSHNNTTMQTVSRPQSNGSEGGGLLQLDGGGDSSSPGLLATAGSSPTSRLPSEITVIPLMSSSATPSSSSSSSNNFVVASGGGNVAASLAGGMMDIAALQQANKTPEGVVPLQCLVNPMDFYQDDIYHELEDLKNRKTEDQILAEIRNFVMRYNIKQTMIAEMTKMSQAYVSRFFRGDTSDMSERTKNMFYTWYLTCKNNPWKLAQMCPNSGVKRMVSDSGDLIPLKRERFTFKAAHLAILEKYYEKDPYPDNDTREKIMEECNKAVSKDRFLSEKEKLTPSVVSNWFNNRRKEAKKLMRQQHALALPFLPSASASGWSPGMPPAINFNTSSSVTVGGQQQAGQGGQGQLGQSSVAILQQHLSAMSQQHQQQSSSSNSSGGRLHGRGHSSGGGASVAELNEEPNLDLSCEIDCDSDEGSQDEDEEEEDEELESDGDGGGHFDADHLMIMELHEEPSRMINIKTET